MQRSRRTGVVVAALSLTLASTGAMAAGSGGSAAPSSKGAKSVRKAGVSVAALQRALGITADGVYGPGTRRAVRRFQRRHGLTVDGIAGPATLAELGLKGKTASSGDPASQLAKIAECESGGDPTAISADGRYRGKYQFTRKTWRGMGGTGDPAKAPEAVQDRLAAALLAARGTSPWPVCG
jgi:Transglycosylase-like domain/Putative peptidoglycan binding domain